MNSPSADARSYRAEWIFPVCGPPIRNGVITIVRGRIVYLGANDDSLDATDLGERAITPGFVNAHTHLDLAHLRGRLEPIGDFAQWLRAVVEHRRLEPPEDAEGAVQSAIIELIEAGTTLVGDVSATGASVPALRAAGLPAIVFREVLGLRPQRFEPLWAAAVNDLGDSSDEVQTALSPHAPYSTSREIYRRAVAVRCDAPIATHWLESDAERRLLTSVDGPLWDFLVDLGAADEAIRPSLFSKDPWHDYLDFPSDRARRGDEVDSVAQWLLVHCNRITADEVERLRRHRSRVAGIVICPRTHAAFRHPPYPYEIVRTIGAGLALGTDSLASNPDLNVFREAQFLASNGSCLNGEKLLEMLTLGGAQALGRDCRTGTLQAGRRADLVVLSTGRERLDAFSFDDLFHADARVAATMIGGRWRFGPHMEAAD